MFKLLGWMIKAAFISAVILILGNTLRFHGKTVSDQVKTTLSHAETSDAIDGIQAWTHEMSTDIAEKTHKAALETKQRLLKKIAARKSASAAHKKAKRLIAESPTAQRKIAAQTSETPLNSPSEDIQASERQELRNLIRQLNDSTEKLSTN